MSIMTPTMDRATSLGFVLASTPRVRAASSGASVVETFGWDTVSAVKISFVNRAVATAGTSPKSFDFQDPHGLYACNGDFSSWSIVQGGDGSNVRMALPVTNLAGWYKLNPDPTPFASGPATVIIEIKLQYLPQEPPAGPQTGIFKKLQMRTTSPAPTDPVVSLVEVDWGEGKPKGYASYVIEAAVVAWGNANLGRFTHVFNTVNLDRTIDKGEWAFCNPTYTTYAYADGASLDTSVLGVLSMTSNRSPGSNTQQLDARAIPPNCEAGFLLSLSRLLGDLVLPTLSTQWPDAKPDQFAVSDRAITLIDGQSFDLPAVAHAGISYTPSLTQFAFKVAGSEIEVTSYTTVEVSPGIHAWCQSTNFYTIELGSKNGAQTLVYKQSQSPIETHGTTQSEGIEITEIILGIVAGLVLVVLTVLTAGAALIVACLVAGILFGVAGAIPEIIQAVAQDDAPAIDMLAFNMTDPITWTGASAFRLKSAALAGPLQLGGDIGP